MNYQSKNLKNQFFIIVLIFVTLMSCHQDALNESEFIQYVTVNSEKQLDNTLYFSSPNEMNSIVNLLKDLPKKERRRWEVKNNFKSYLSELEDFYSSLEMIETEEEFYEIIAKNMHLVKLKDSTVIEKIKHPVGQLISNGDGIFQHSTFINKYEGTEYSTYSIDDYLKNKNFEELSVLNDEHKSKQSIFRANSQKEDYLNGSYTRNERGCKKDRKLNAEIYTDLISRTWRVKDQNGFEYVIQVNYPEVYCIINPFKKSFCNWVRYSTTIDIRAQDFSIDVFNNSQNYDLNDIYGLMNDGDKSRIQATGPSSIRKGWYYFTPGISSGYLYSVSHGIYGDLTINEPDVASDYFANYQGFNSVFVKASTTGIGNAFVIIDYNGN